MQASAFPEWSAAPGQSLPSLRLSIKLFNRKVRNAFLGSKELAPCFCTSQRNPEVILACFYRSPITSHIDHPSHKASGRSPRIANGLPKAMFAHKRRELPLLVRQPAMFGESWRPSMWACLLTDQSFRLMTQPSIALLGLCSVSWVFASVVSQLMFSKLQINCQICQVSA